MKNLLSISVIPIVIVEIFIASFILFLIGFLFSKDDPLLLKGFFSPTLLVGLVFSLYYGLVSSMLFLLVVAIASFFLYSPPPYRELLWHSLVFLVASEFHYYWQKRIKEAELERGYFEEQVSILRRELFILKLSHDQLELNYVLRPYSLRRILEEFRERLLKMEDEKSLLDLFLKILLQSFNVYGAVIFSYKHGELKPLVSLGNGKPETNDLLLRKAIEEESSVYLTPKALKEIQNNNIHYVAVIREEADGEIYLLAIKDILFVNLNEEVLNYIYIIFSYILEDIVFSRKLKEIYGKAEIPCSFNFVKELYKMSELYRKQGIESSVVFFSFNELPETYPYDLETAIRKLDMLCILEEQKLVVFLLPFTSILGAKSFAERIQRQFPALKLVRITKVKENNLKQYIKEATYNAG